MAADTLGSFESCDYQHGPTADDYIAWCFGGTSLRISICLTGFRPRCVVGPVDAIRFDMSGLTLNLSFCACLDTFDLDSSGWKANFDEQAF